MIDSKVLEEQARDLAFASRCMFGIDAKESVEKLTGRAKRMVCISLPVNKDKFRSSDAPYDLSGFNLNEFARSVVDAAREMGYEPEIQYMEHGWKTENPAGCS